MRRGAEPTANELDNTDITQVCKQILQGNIYSWLRGLAHPWAFRVVTSLREQQSRFEYRNQQNPDKRKR